MGREVMRVPLDFDFPINGSYADFAYDREMKEHAKTCDAKSHDNCELPYWRESMPHGEGWQLWQTVSDGPVTPVFATAEELIDYMCQPCDCGKPWCKEPYPDMPSGKGWRREVAEPFVKKCGWAPSMVISGGRIVSGPEAMVANARIRESK
jgi:hypothetical protein